ncbi:uncharacterized protein AFUA_2G15165 [Aspergillus fumigatus Af293]|uniref:Uncharacterized protein n=2 Tax=Aspergillus fumigatus TaxID=746128 RepID=Q4X002_ASPFU|nr:hypothetical protein AFUA_2G15165 [Aspergillus fumigatus Af293]EAL93813.1 hypothetical protein AFUA_2G15165 [Aspergillus fumigatus Af293]EDP55022.1 hypothetical protein AFUB_030830 [Aspergillus fumigatus A1163]
MPFVPPTTSPRLLPSSTGPIPARLSSPAAAGLCSTAAAVSTSANAVPRTASSEEGPWMSRCLPCDPLLLLPLRRDLRVLL